MMSTRSSALRCPSWRRNTLTICSRLLERLPPLGFSRLKSGTAVDTRVAPGPEGRCGTGLMVVPAAAFTVHAERRTAAAGGGRLRILDREAAAGDGIHEVHFGALQVADADRVHEQADAVRLEDLVASPVAFLDHQPVLEARAAAALHEHSKAAADLALFGEQLVDLLGCGGGHVDHCSLLVRTV